MSIHFNRESQTFHLYNDEISYIMKVTRSGHLGQLYYGKRVRDRDNYDYLLETEPRSMSVCCFEGDLSYSLEHIKQEYPVWGTGDMHLPALDVRLPDGSRLLDLTYRSHEILAGKPGLKGLPAVYVEDASEAETLVVELGDAKAELTVRLFYTIYEAFPVIARHTEIRYDGKQEAYLEQAMSLSLDLPDMDYEMVELTGAWARERHVAVRKLQYGVQGVYSLRGCSSHHFNPFLALKRPNCDERNGEVYAFSLVYSGNFAAQADADPYHMTRVTMGIHPQGFSWRLTEGETFTTPEAVMVYTDRGLNAMSQVFHRLYQSRLARGRYRDQVRPVLVNNWEATYFQFDENRLLPIAQEAKDLGIELFVLDDGWFTNRNDEHCGLGDWEIDRTKLPEGLAGLAEKIKRMGLRFGLWIEPEMVNAGTKLFHEHPEWVLHQPGRRMSQGRYQYVLDYSNPEVVEHIYGKLCGVLEGTGISYIKWDMNRSISEAYSCTAGSEDQGKVLHRYILGVYHLYEKLTEHFPEILFESCASGGARFDPGMLYYAPQCWTSDNTDAVERLKIQYGTSFVYPLSSMGAHVAAVPNHQVQRKTSLRMRANVACFGDFGYELDLTALTEEGKEKTREQIRFVKKYREILQFGTFYRLLSPFEGNEAAWMVVSEDRRTALVGYYRILQEINAGYRRVRLAGLDPEQKYRVSILDKECYGDELMHIGLITTDTSSGDNREGAGDFVSRIYVLEGVE